MQDLVIQYFEALIGLVNEMAPYLLLGFLIAGILHVYIPAGKLNRYIGRPNLKSAINAAFIGVPLPLCSCGVIPTGISMYKNGAAKGPTVSFLISTPQTGVDSILATYGMLGWPLALMRPIIAFITGIFGGAATNHIERGSTENTSVSQELELPASSGGKLKTMLRYAFVDFMNDIAKWLVIGLLLAALMAVLIPDGFFTDYISNEYLSMFIVLLASIPLYVCATGSVPIAAVLLMKGLSPGAAIVFLMAGPATNAATITVIGKVMGRKTLLTYMFAIIGGALLFGILINAFVPREWIMAYVPVMDHTGHGAHLLPHWLEIGSGILLTLLLINGQIQRKLWLRKTLNTHKENGIPEHINLEGMIEKTIAVKGMTCNHCKANVEKNLGQLQGIEEAVVDLEKGEVHLSGDTVNLDEIKDTVEGIGYEYVGEA